MENIHCLMCQEQFDESEMVIRIGKKWCKPCNKEQDFYNDIMSEALIEEEKYIKEVNRFNGRIFKAVASLKGEKYLSDLKDYMKDCECNGKIRIVRKPAGNKQNESWGKVKNAWVDQYSVGDSGDSYCGTVSVKIKKGRWLEMPFAT